MSDRIEIKIDASALTPEKFIAAVESFLSVVQGVGQNLATRPINWTVEVDKGSAVLRMVATNPSQESNRAIEAVGLGLRSLRSGIRTMPEGFTQREIGWLRNLAALVEQDGIRSVSVKNGGEAQDVPQSIIPIADAMLHGESHIAFGSVEGKVVALSSRHGFCCTVYEPIYRREIACYLQNAEAENQAIAAFQQRARILASGLIHYSREGFPVNITADSVRVFPAESELPSVEQIQEIYRSYR
jgi:hypothetical protein